MSAISQFSPLKWSRHHFIYQGIAILLLLSSDFFFVQFSFLLSLGWSITECSLLVDSNKKWSIFSFPLLCISVIFFHTPFICCRLLCPEILCEDLFYDNNASKSEKMSAFFSGDFILCIACTLCISKSILFYSIHNEKLIPE